MSLWGVGKTETAPAAALEKALFGALVAVMGEAIVVYDRSFKVSVFNQRAEDIFRIKASEIVGQNFTLERAQEAKWQALSPVIYASLAPTVVRLSEVGVSPEVLKIILENPHRELETATIEVGDHFLKIIKDKSREAELLKAKSEFITIAGHQLRTPTTAANWAFENLKKVSGLDTEAQQLIDTGYKAVQAALKIINDLLNAAQIEEGRFGFQFQDVNLVEFLDQVLAGALPAAKESKINIYFDRPEENEVIISADSNRLAMAVTNLIDNAIKYNVSGGEVTVKLEVKDSQAQVSVKDTGVGVKEEDIAKLFSKFFRGENIKKTVPTGSGLGLYIAKNIIEAHKGKVWVESVPNRGSTFYFSIPLKVKS